MRKRLLTSLVSLALLSGTVSAQTLDSVLGGSTGTSGASTGGLGGGGGTGSLGISTLSTPSITAMDSTTTSSAVLNQSNVLGAYYANPYFQGRAGATNSVAPGGFGTALYGTGSTAGGTAGRGGFAGGTTTGIGTGTSTGRTSTGFGGTSGSSATGGLGGLGGRAGAFGGQGGLGGFGTTAANSAQVLPLPRQIAYTATFQFPVQPMTMPRMVSDARAILDRSTMLPAARNIEIATEGTVLVLRGTVASEDDARLAENMLRLTPGVREIRNELKFPGANRP